MNLHSLELLLAGFAAGIINSVSGGGSFIIFPLLIAQGIPAVMANATTTIIVQPGTVSSAIGYRRPLRKLSRYYFLLLIPGVLGSVTGARILRHTPNAVFGRVVPFFILTAVILLAFQPRIHKWAVKRKKRKPKNRLVFALVLGMLFFVLATYGGYFGAGYGIMALGLLGLTELKDIHQMNGLKNVIGVGLGISSVIYFISHHLIYWQILPLLITSNIIGGYLGATHASKLPSSVIRFITIAIGLIISVIFFNKYY